MGFALANFGRWNDQRAATWNGFYGQMQNNPIVLHFQGGGPVFENFIMVCLHCLLWVPVDHTVVDVQIKRRMNDKPNLLIRLCGLLRVEGDDLREFPTHKVMVTEAQVPPVNDMEWH